MNIHEYEPKRSNNPSRPLYAHGNGIYEDAQTRMRLGYARTYPDQELGTVRPLKKAVLVLAHALISLGRL